MYVVVHIKADKIFERDGYDIYTDLHINYPQAVLGDKVEIDTLDGKKRLVIPEGVDSHQQIRLKGLGVPNLSGSGRGSHYVRVIVDIPKKINRNAKKLIQDLIEEL